MNDRKGQVLRQRATDLLFWIFSRFSLIFSFMVAFSCCKRWNSDFMILASLSSSRWRVLMSRVLSCRISSSIGFSSSSASFISASPSPAGLLPSFLSSPPFLSLLSSPSSRFMRSSSSSRVDMLGNVVFATRENGICLGEEETSSVTQVTQVNASWRWKVKARKCRRRRGCAWSC